MESAMLIGPNHKRKIREEDLWHMSWIILRNDSLE